MLSSVAFPDREDEAATLVRALGAPGRDGVACSQGEVILDLLRRIAAADHLDPDEPLVARKGSVWALTFLEERLFQMDYIDARR